MRYTIESESCMSLQQSKVVRFRGTATPEATISSGRVDVCDDDDDDDDDDEDGDDDDSRCGSEDCSGDNSGSGIGESNRHGMASRSVSMMGRG